MFSSMPFANISNDPKAVGRQVRTVQAAVETIDGVGEVPYTVVQRRPMARNYVITDPEQIGERLKLAGYNYQITRRSRSIWRAILQVSLGVDSNYWHRAIIHCANDGRTALSIMPAPERIVCENIFYSAPIRMRHNGPEIREFMAQPARFLEETLAAARTLAERLEGFRGERISFPFNLHDYLQKRPRLHRAYQRQIERYPQNTVWGVLQTMSATKSPTLVRAASYAAQEDLRAGYFHTPLYDALLRADPKAFETN